MMKVKTLLIVFLLPQICLVAQENNQVFIQPNNEPIEAGKIAGIIGKISAQAQKQDFQPNFASLERSNPVPEWFKDAKFGIYFHWGVYSVPAFGSEWYPRNMYIKGSPENKHHIEIYGDPSQWPYNNFVTGAKDKQGNFVQFAPKLKSEGGKFDPEEWAQLFADAGAKFAGPVAEHHDGTKKSKLGRKCNYGCVYHFR